MHFKKKKNCAFGQLGQLLAMQSIERWKDRSHQNITYHILPPIFSFLSTRILLYLKLSNWNKIKIKSLMSDDDSRIKYLLFVSVPRKQSTFPIDHRPFLFLWLFLSGLVCRSRPSPHTCFYQLIHESLYDCWSISFQFSTHTLIGYGQLHVPLPLT